jgi:hypothetical protein
MICLKQLNYNVGIDAVNFLMNQENGGVCQKQIMPEMYIPNEVTLALANSPKLSSQSMKQT